MKRAMQACVAGIVLCAGLSPTMAAAAQAAAKLMPAEIQSTFFNGAAFNAASPSGVKFKMTFTADGKAKRVPAGKGGSKADGDWKLDDEGYCTTWKGGKPNCFTVVPSGQNKWSVMKGSTVAAVWSK